MNATAHAAENPAEIHRHCNRNAVTAIATATLLLCARLIIVTVGSLFALCEIGIVAPFVRGDSRSAVRSDWLHRWCSIACRVLGITVRRSGQIPRSGLLVCNHLSYLDIIVISSLAPCVFVAKSDVAHWPLFGWLARAAGTIFTHRNRRLAANGTIQQIRQAMDGGNLVVLFPEGTSSDGATVLPFKPALLQSATEAKGSISAAAIDYELTDGSAADEICYWRDMTLVPHLLNLFTKTGIEAKISVGSAACHQRDRKELARELRRKVMALRA